MLKRILISTAGALALAAFAFSPQSATAASLAAGAAATQAAEADLSDVVNVHRRWRRQRSPRVHPIRANEPAALSACPGLCFSLRREEWASLPSVTGTNVNPHLGPLVGKP